MGGGGQSAAPAAPAPSLWDRMKGKVDEWTTPTPYQQGSHLPASVAAQDAFSVAPSNLTKRAARSLFGMADFGVQNASHLVKAIGGDEQEKEKLADSIESFGPAGMGALTDQVKGYAADAHKDPRMALTNAGGDALALATAHAVPKVAGTALDAAGSGLKKAGRLTGEVVAKTNALDREYSTRPGAGISENRIVALTRPSLLRKVKDTVPDLKAQETAVLSNSTAPPIDLSQPVNSPFDAIRNEKANPTTGAAPPPQMRQLSLTQAILNAQTDPITGQPIPIPRRLVQSPVEAAQFKSNIGEMANYDTVDSTLANQALKGAGAGIRDQIVQAVPESAPITQRLHDTLGLRDKLQSQIGGSGQALPPGGGILSKAVNAVADPLLVGGGTTAASLMDLVGSGLKKAGGMLNPSVAGHPPTPSSTVPPPTSPAAPGQLALPAPQGPGGAPVVIPPQLPPVASPTRTINPASPPPNVAGSPQAYERVSGFYQPEPVAPTYQPSTGGLKGPIGQFATRPRGKFGPKVETNAFTTPSTSLVRQIAGDQPVRTTPDSLHPSMGSQEEANVGAGQHQQVADGFANQATQATLLDQISGKSATIRKPKGAK